MLSFHFPVSTIRLVPASVRLARAPWSAMCSSVLTTHALSERGTIVPRFLATNYYMARLAVATIAEANTSSRWMCARHGRTRAMTIPEIGMPSEVWKCATSADDRRKNGRQVRSIATKSWVGEHDVDRGQTPCRRGDSALI